MSQPKGVVLPCRKRVRLPGVDLIDVIIKDGSLHFLYFDQQGDLQVQEKVIISDVEYQPWVKRRSNGQPLWPIPRYNHIRWCSNYIDPKDVFDRLYDLFSTKCELPTQRHPILVSGWVAGTHIARRLVRKPYLIIVGPPGRGKSLLLRWISPIVPRGLLTSTLREGFMVRADEFLDPTLCVDVVDVMRSAKSGGSSDILVGSYEEDLFTFRVTKPHSKSPEDAFNVWESSMFMAFASNKPLWGPLATRAFEIPMPNSKRSFPEADPKEGLRLKEELIALRVAGMPLVEVPKPFAGRFGDNWQVVLSVVESMAPQYVPDLRILMNEYRADEQTQISTSDDAELVVAVAQAFVKVGRTLEVQTAAVRDTWNETHDDNKLSTDQIGRRLSESLGLKRVKVAQGTQRGTKFKDEDELRDLCTRLGVDFPERSRDGASSQPVPVVVAARNPWWITE